MILLFSKSSYSVEPEEFLQNPKQEMRARNITKNIRCLVCQNQSIDDSSAPLAKDLRVLIRTMVQKNNTDEEIYKFLTDRYGDFILLKPPIKIDTFLLWSLPFVFFMIGIFILFLHNKKSKKTLSKFNILLIFVFFSV
jgi:cytochrome c-type biogenesis protein CcmH